MKRDSDEREANASLAFQGFPEIFLNAINDRELRLWSTSLCRSRTLVAVLGT